MKMIRPPRSNWMLAFLMVLAAALGAATLRAAAQSVMTGPRAPQPQAAAAPGDASRSSETPADQGKQPSDQGKQPASQAPAPATQPKDTTSPAAAPAPDIRGSADNNVSFPVDI